MKAETFRVYNDPGHGWIAVKRALLIELGVEGKITRFSYQRGATVYLEEDCDATTFIEAFRAKYGTVPTFVSSHSNRSSRIRSYESFCSEEARHAL